MDPDELKRWENTIMSFVCMGSIALVILAFAVRWVIKILKGEDDA